ncbi:MAG: hypothetical protein COA91_08555 [Robiginitomaculum sp.]|nr:MAG: hypothetical protein COA91_08555 [Robiginitomaculum sp.]
MIIWIRNIVIIFVLLSIIYVILSLVSRFKQRAKLKIEYDASKPDTAKDEFVAKGMQKYARSFRSKLFLGVYVIPLIIFVGLLYLANKS